MKKHLINKNFLSASPVAICIAALFSSASPAFAQGVWYPTGSPDEAQKLENWGIYIENQDVTVQAGSDTQIGWLTAGANGTFHVDGDSFSISYLNAWDNGVFHVGTDATESVLVDTIQIFNSHADIHGSNVTINNSEGGWNASLAVKAGSKLTLGLNDNDIDQILNVAGPSSHAELSSGGSVDLNMALSISNHDESSQQAGSPAVSVKARDNITLARQVGIDAYGSLEMASEQGDIQFNAGLSVSNHSKAGLTAQDGEVKFTNGSIGIMSAGDGSPSSVEVLAKSLRMENGGISVDDSTRQSAFNFTGESFYARSISSGNGGTIGIQAQKIQLDEQNGSYQAIQLNDANLTIGSDSSEVTINGSVTATAYQKESSTVIKGAVINIDAAQGKNSRLVLVQGKNNRMEIGGAGSQVDIHGKLFADSGNLSVDGRTIAIHNDGGDGEAVRVVQAGRTVIGHEDTQNVSFTGKLLTSAQGSRLEVNGQHISVKQANPDASYQGTLVNSSSSDVLRLGNAASAASATQSLQIDGTVVTYDGEVQLFGDTITVNGAFDGGRSNLSKVSLNAPQGRITAGDSRTSLITLNGSVVSNVGPMAINGQAIKILADKNEAAVISDQNVGGWSTEPEEPLEIGSEGVTRSIQIEGEVQALRRSVELHAADLISISADTDYAVEAMNHSAFIGSDDTGLVSLDQAVIARGGAIDIRGKNISLSTEKQLWAATAGGNTVTLGSGESDLLIVKGGLLSTGSALDAQARMITIDAKSSEVAGQANGSTLTIGGAQTQLAALNGMLKTEGGQINLQGQMLAIDANGADSALRAHGGSIAAGTEGPGDILAVTGNVRALGGSINLGSSQLEAALVKGMIEAQGGPVSLQGKHVLLSDNGESYAAHAIGSSIQIGTDDAQEIVIQGRVLAGSEGAQAGSGTGSLVDISQGRGQASVLLTGSLEAHAGGIANASFNTADSLLDGSILSHGGSSVVNALFKSGQLSGDIRAEEGGIVNAIFLDKAIFSGSVFTNGRTSLALASGSVWNVKANSNVTSLDVDDSAVISLRGAASTLTVDEAQSGSGALFSLDLDASNKNRRAASNQSDYLFFNGSTEGAQKIDFDTTRLSGLAVGDKLYFASVADSGLSFSSTKDLNHLPVEGSLYDLSYAIDHESSGEGSDWFISALGRHDNGAAALLADYGLPGFLLGSEMDRRR